MCHVWELADLGPVGCVRLSPFKPVASLDLGMLYIWCRVSISDMLQMLGFACTGAEILLKGRSTVVILKLSRQSETPGGMVTNADFQVKSEDSALVV